MVDFSPTQLLIIGAVVVVVLALIVLGLRRGSLKSANIQGLGMRAGLEGGREAKPLPDQTIQTDDFKSKYSLIRIVRGSRTSFKRTRFKHSVLEIVPDNGATPPDRANPSDPAPGQDAP